MNKDQKQMPPRCPTLRILVGSCAAVAAVLVALLVVLAPRLIKDAKLRAMMADVKAGKSTAVFAPDPSLLEDALKDREFAARLNLVGIESKSTINDDRLSLLKRFPNLQAIWIEYAGNADVFLEHIQGMASLEELCFHHAHFSAAGARFLAGFPRLKRLRHDRATDETLSQIRDLTQLEELEINYGEVSDAALEHLKHLTRLKKLDLWYTGLSNQAIASLQKALPNCTISVNQAGRRGD